jgi:hypothetical protein
MIDVDDEDFITYLSVICVRQSTYKIFLRSLIIKNINIRLHFYRISSSRCFDELKEFS